MTSSVMMHGSMKPMIICLVAAFGSASSGCAALKSSMHIMCQMAAAALSTAMITVRMTLSVTIWQKARRTDTSASVGPLRQSARIAKMAAPIEAMQPIEKPAKTNCRTQARIGRRIESIPLAMIMLSYLHLMYFGSPCA